MKKIVLISTGQPSTNPRMVKEANSLQAAGYEVTVLYQYVIDWAIKADLKLLMSVRWNYRLVGGTPKSNWLLFSYIKLRHKLFCTLNKKIGNKFSIAERSQTRSYDELLKSAKKIKANWYIGHNLGALAIAVKAATHNKAKVGFDFEDYYRGEKSNEAPLAKSRLHYLENKYVPSLNYISTSSPLIEEKIIAHYPEKKGIIFSLLNCFPIAQQPLFSDKKENNNALRLFWFSQTVGRSRGLEDIIEALIQLNNPNIKLTITGRVNDAFNEYINTHNIRSLTNINFTGPVSPDDIWEIAVKNDIGLALEPGKDENNRIALSNKIFTYLLAGNAIIFSDTPAQRKFFEENTELGMLYQSGNIESLKELLLKLIESPAMIEDMKRKVLKTGIERYNWENESKKLIAIIENS